MPLPPLHSPKSWLAGPLGALTRGVAAMPRVVLIAAALTALAALLVAARWLEFRTSRLDLLNPDSAFNQRWLAYLDEFGDQDDVVVVVQGDRPAVIAAIDELAMQLEADAEWFESVLARRDLRRLRGKSLHYLSRRQLQQLDGFLGELQPVLDGDWSQLNVLRIFQRAGRQVATRDAKGRLSRAAAAGPRDTAAAVLPAAFHEEMAAADRADESAGMERLLASLTAALSDARPYQSPWPGSLRGLSELDGQFTSRPLYDERGRMGFVLLRLKHRQQSFVGHAAALARLREIVDDAAARNSDVQIGLTGMPVLENDEMQISQRDTLWASTLSLFGVAGVFIAGFGGVRRPLLTVAALLVALAWSCGFVTLAVGHLNILSVSFGVILIGLGIDFGIHYVAHYSQQLQSGAERVAALVAAARHVGPGILVGGATTALAFCCAALTRFTGVAELGVIAAGGILLCVASALTVLPALIVLCDRPRPPRPWQAPLPVARLCAPLQKRPRLALSLAVLLTAFLATGLVWLRYDHNLLNLQPAGLKSVQLSRRLAAGQDRGVWYAVSVCGTRDQLLHRKQALEALPQVAATEELVSVLPREDPDKQRLIARIHQRLSHLPAAAPLIPVAGRAALQSELARWQVLASHQTATLPLDALGGVDPGQYYQRLSQFQQRMADELLALLHTLRALADPRPPRIEDLSGALADRFVGRRGRHLLKVYGRGDIWDMRQLSSFVAAVEAIDPHISGHPVQTYYASRQMLQSYVHAAVYSLLAVSIVLMIDFRRIRYWLLAMAPMALGMTQLFGLLGWLGIPLNPANLIVLPLILGIGIDDGVHVTHDYLRQRRRYRMSNATAAAVVLTSATTMIGFGTMMFAAHQGLRSLGQVLTIGIACCLVSSLFALPPLLVWAGGGFSAAGRADKLEDSANSQGETHGEATT